MSSLRRFPVPGVIRGFLVRPSSVYSVSSVVASFVPLGLFYSRLTGSTSTVHPGGRDTPATAAAGSLPRTTTCQR